MEAALQLAYTVREGKPALIRYADDVRHVTQNEILLTEKGGSEVQDLIDIKLSPHKAKNTQAETDRYSDVFCGD